MSKAEECALQHQYVALSYATAIICFLLFVSTSALNFVIVFIIYRNRQNKFKNLFYKLLQNIAVSDALVGLIADTCFVAIHISEAKNSGLQPQEAMVAHTIMFILGGVSLLTLVFLCIDRIYAILRPHSYRRGVSKTSTGIMFITAWGLPAVLVPIYFICGFMKYLIVFTSFNVLLPFIFLIMTALIYHKILVAEVTKEDHPNLGSQKATLSRKDRSSTKKGRKATKSFLKMLLVFIFSYLPASFITIYFSLCTFCNCLLIQILRDVSIVFILSGSLFRAINFLMSLKSLKKEVKYILSRKHREESCSGST